LGVFAAIRRTTLDFQVKRPPSSAERAPDRLREANPSEAPEHYDLVSDRAAQARSTFGKTFVP
jgi:hypothetical protein